MNVVARPSMSATSRSIELPVVRQQLDAVAAPHLEVTEPSRSSAARAASGSSGGGTIARSDRISACASRT
jgi:hypothetical protein